MPTNEDRARCDDTVMEQCSYYQASVQKRVDDLRAWRIAILITFVSYLLSGLVDDSLPNNWFVMIIMLAGPSLCTSLLREHRGRLKTTVSIFQNCLCAIVVVVGFLGLAGVFTINDGLLRVTNIGMYIGVTICTTRKAFLFLAIIVASDVFSFIVYSIVDVAHSNVTASVKGG